jgi:hypothetical protein
MSMPAKPPKKWYVLHVYYEGTDGRRKHSQSKPSDDFSGLHAQMCEKVAVGFQASVEEVPEPRRRKVLTKRQREDAYVLPLFQDEIRKKKGIHK